ncbi:MAG: hypothetical protein HWN68_14090 [Desulfobacterales bacterium]|nr:hypothetical protein [Desulfobacterales bacterium]
MEAEEQIRNAVECRQCRSPMELFKTKKYHGRWPLALMASGVFCCLFFIGALVGIPMLLLGIYMATAKETISLCPKCGHYYKVWMSVDSD